MRTPIRPVTAVTIVLSALAGGAIAVGAIELPGLSDRPTCPETVMKAVSSDRPVAGAFECFDTPVQHELQTNGIDSDGAFATLVGQNGEYHFLHKTADGGYVYEYDRMKAPHDRVQGALSALGWPTISADVRRGDLAAAWHVRNDFRAAWSEITGQTQSPNSMLFTFYLDGDGRIAEVK